MIIFDAELINFYFIFSNIKITVYFYIKLIQIIIITSMITHVVFNNNNNK